MKKALVCGAGGFIGGHLVKKLKKRVVVTFQLIHPTL